MERIPLTLHFTGTCNSYSANGTTTSLIKSLTNPAVASVTGINGVTTADNLTGNVPAVGDRIIWSITPSALSTSSLSGGTTVLSVTTGTTASTKKITFGSSAGGTTTTATALSTGVFYPTVTRYNGAFTFATTDAVPATSTIHISYTETGTAIRRNIEVSVASVVNNSGIYTVTTASTGVGTQNDTVSDITTFTYTNAGILGPSQSCSFQYNIPEWIANIPCQITMANLYTSSSAIWSLYLEGITQINTYELTSPSTQKYSSTKLGITSNTNDYLDFYGSVRSGVQTFTLNLERLKAPTADESSLTIYFTLQLLPL